VGFLQLVDLKKAEVIAQRNIFDAPYLENHSSTSYCPWPKSENTRVVYAEHSDVSQPYKFFSALPNKTFIKIYNQLGSIEPLDQQPQWTGTAEELDQFKCSGHDVAGDEWEAFSSDGTWVGTSEY